MVDISRRTKNLIIRTVIEIILLGALIATDLSVKDFLYHYLENGSISKDFIPGVLSLTYVENTGAGFGSFQGNTLALSIITLLLLTAVVVFLVGSCVTEFLKKKSKNGNQLKIHTVTRIALIFILAGGLANLVDRFCAIDGSYYFHGVRDYFNAEFMDFPVWNLADTWVVVGAALLIIYLIVSMIIESSSSRKKQKEQIQHSLEEYLASNTAKKDNVEMEDIKEEPQEQDEVEVFVNKEIDNE